MSNSNRGVNRGKVGRPANLIRQTHFVKGEDEKFYCKYCTQSYASSTSSGNLTNHMKNSHKDKLSPEDLGIRNYVSVASCPDGMMNMGFDHDLPTIPSTPMPSAHSVPLPRHSSPSFLNNTPSPIENQSLSFFVGNGERIEPINYAPNSTLPLPNYQPQIVCSTSYDQAINMQNSPLHNNFTTYPQSFAPRNDILETPNMDVEQSINYYSDMIGTLSDTPFGKLPTAFEVPTNLELHNPTIFQIKDNLATQPSIKPEPINEIVTYLATNSEKSRKRKHEISAGSFYELNILVEDLLESGKGKEEIQRLVEEAILEKPILFNAFLKRNIDTLQMVDNRFGQISLSLLGDGLIGQRKDAIKQILFEQCNRHWDPCLFQVYIFPFHLRNKLYCTVELGFQNLNSQRRSCILDCIEIPFDAHTEFIGGAVVNLLKHFGVETKLSEVAIKGQFFKNLEKATGRTVLEKDLTEYLRDQIKVKDQRLKIKLSNSRKDYAERVVEYFEVPGIDHSDETYRVQMKLANYDSLLCEIKESYLKAIEKAKMELVRDDQLRFNYNQTMYIGNNVFCSSIEAEQAKSFLESVTNQLRLIQNAMIKLQNAAKPIESRLCRIGNDSNYHIYYLPTNAREKLNLLRLVPLLNYEKELQNVNRLLEGFAECINRYYSGNFALSETSVDELTEYFNLIEIDSKDLVPDDYDVSAVSFEDWEEIYKQGLRIFNQYFETCELLVNISKGSMPKSFYVNEFKKMDKYTPPEIQFDKFKKLAFLKAWKTFEETFKLK